MQPSDPSTPGLSPEQRARVDALLDELLDLPGPRRTAHLRSLRLADAAVEAEVESLLRAAAASDGFMSSPARPQLQAPIPDAAIGIRLGAWRITSLIGRGGIGEVYEAVRADADFEQRVAVKLLQREANAQLERFQAERQILARLEHPGIARLYDGGVTDDGRPYMVMEFVEGRPITQFCTLSASTLPARLELFLQVCEAVAYAHRNLIVHRDLKPSNILVTAKGEVKLLDFGIAKLIDSQRAQLTEAQVAPLTPICAAPEQLSGGPITTATDVYALGLLLFELLTGVHPWLGPETPVLQAMRMVLQKPAPVPSKTAETAAEPPVPARSIRGDLDAIVAKALRKEPIRRYPTVDAMKLDVQRALRGEAVEAREGARMYVVGRLLRRYRWAAAAAAAVFISLGSGLGIAAWQAQKAAVERDAARRDAAREEAVRYSLTRLFRAAITDQGAQTVTAKGMIDGSSLRVLHEYRDQPDLQSQIVLTLADLYGALEDVNGAGTLLEGFLKEAKSGVDPGALADARQKLANIELLQGHTDRAKELLDQAEAFWAASARPHPEERLEGLTIRARLQRARGDLDGAIAANREAIEQRIALSGHDHRETAILYNSLAISLASANRLDEALDAYHETAAIYRALGLGDGLDAQIIIANTGTLDLRTGHLREAEVLLKSAVERERALAGDSAAVAAALGYYGKVLSVTDRNAAAVGVLREAADLGVRFAGAKSPVALQNRIFLGESQLAAGDLAGARATLGSARDDALEQYGPANLLPLRAGIALAQVSAADGHYADAQSRLLDVVAALRKLGNGAITQLALALENLGDAQLHQGAIAQAKLTLEETVALRERATGQTWELAQARERLGEALAAQGDVGARQLLRQAADGLESALGANHPQTLRAKGALARASTPRNEQA